ncbi:MAG: class I SAM-dependent methyltransferase [Alphaproteobacteria bacterium]
MLSARFLQSVIRSGDLRLIDANGKEWQFGDGGAPRSTIRLHDKRLHTRLLTNPKLYLGEAYMDGSLTIEEGTLYDLIDVAAANFERVEHHRLQELAQFANRYLRVVQQHNPVRKARRNAAHHYDLSNELYDLFLDNDRQYSCAYFAGQDDDLETAQLRKKRHLAAKLLLDRPGRKVLDIGSGWGGLGIYLAQVAGADVTGITLSTNQHKVSEQRAAEAGLSDRVHFHLRDYREQGGTFDRIVSVGMFEHVGVGHYAQFFRKVKSLLSDDGVALLHSIGRMQPPGSTNPWLRKYIFPGGYAPALSEVVSAVEKVGLWITDVEILRLHYADTVREWRRRFQANRDRAKDLYDERFCRMWEFYLSGAEIAFRRMGQMVFQMQLAKRQDAVPLVRDYVTDWERNPPTLHEQAAE